MPDRPGPRPLRPLDYLPARSRRYVAVDHRGRVTALVAHGPESTNEVRTGLLLDGHGCPVFGEEHFGSTGGSVTDKSWDGAASRFTDEQYQESAAACDADTGEDSGQTVKQRCFLPHHEPDGTVNSNGVHAAAQRVSSLKGHDAAAVEKAKAHLRSHYTKDLKEDPPKSIGGDASALYAIVTSEDGHQIVLKLTPTAASLAPTCACGHSGCENNETDGECDMCGACVGQMTLAARAEGRTYNEIATVLGIDEEELILATRLALGASHPAFTGSHTHEHSAMGSQGGDETHTHEHSHDGDGGHAHSHGAAASVGEAFRAGANQGQLSSKALDELLHHHTIVDPLVAAGPDVPQIVANPGGAWHAYLHVEGIRTDDGREIAMGATQFPDLPVSLRYLKEDEGGHWGAITCGRIDTMEMQTVEGITVCYATGVFGTDEMGQRAQLAVEEQTQRFISIDPRDVEGEYIEVQVSTGGGGIFDIIGDDEPGGIYDGWFRMTSFVVGAATIVPVPALQQAVITMADQPLPMAPLATERAMTQPVIVAAGAPADWPADPPAEWFNMAPPTIGDPRLVRQPDGKYAVPWTITESGQVFGHACYWGQEHTGLPGRVRPPRSATYAHFMTGERSVVVSEDADGQTLERIAVGKVTMGCGHAGLHVGAKAAIAHYDGGYGAVQIADVRAVEDDFGIWLCGALCPPYSEANPGGPTAAQVAQCMSLDLSPDWRKIAGKLHMLALLAVPVGGFPVARESLVAAGLAALSDDDLAGVARSVTEGNRPGGEVVAMVAAGRVRRTPIPERMRSIEDVVFGEDLTEILTEYRRERARQRLAALTDV